MECTQRGAQKSAPPARFLLSVFRVVLTPAVAGIMRAQGVEVDSPEDLVRSGYLLNLSIAVLVLISCVSERISWIVFWYSRPSAEESLWRFETLCDIIRLATLYEP